MGYFDALDDGLFLGRDGAPGAVLYSEQDLTPAQREQARANIGAEESGSVAAVTEADVSGWGFIKEVPPVVSSVTLDSSCTLSGGTVCGGTICGSTLQYVTLADVVALTGALCGGTIDNSTLKDGVICGSTSLRGVLSGGEICGSTICGSTIECGTICGSTIEFTTLGNVSLSGALWGGTICGSTICGGTMDDVSITLRSQVGSTDGLLYLVDSPSGALSGGPAVFQKMVCGANVSEALSGYYVPAFFNAT